MIKEIDRNSWDSAKRTSNLRYKPIYMSLSSKVGTRDFKYSGSNVEKVVRGSAEVFTTAYEALDDLIENDSELSGQLNHVSKNTYISYFSSKLIETELRELVNKDGFDTLVNDQRKIENGFKNDKFSQIRGTLEGLLEFMKYPGRCEENALDYFSKTSALSYEKLEKVLSTEEFNKIKDVKIKIRGKELELQKTVVKNIEKGEARIDKIETEKFHTPLQYLALDKKTVLDREKIVGDRSVIDNLEKSVGVLLKYNSTYKRNVLKDLGLFDQNVVLQGMPGEGKSEVCKYIVNYAELESERLGKDLVVTQFDFFSSYLNGSIQKIRSQFKQITDGKGIVLVYNDEIDQILEENDGQSGSKNKDVIREFQTFFEGSYPNHGNYMVLGTINDMETLPAAIRSRVTPYNWEGAKGAKNKGVLFSYKLEEGIKLGYVDMPKSDFDALGQAAHNNNLSGRDISKVCTQVKISAFNFDGIDEIDKAGNDYEMAINSAVGLFDKIDSQMIYNKLQDLVRNRENAINSSEQYRKL